MTIAKRGYWFEGVYFGSFEAASCPNCKSHFFTDIGLKGIVEIAEIYREHRLIPLKVVYAAQDIEMPVDQESIPNSEIYVISATGEEVDGTASNGTSLLLRKGEFKTKCSPAIQNVSEPIVSEVNS